MPILRALTVSWFAVYRMCNDETVTRSNNPFFQWFSTGFDVLATNTSPLDPVTKPDMTIHTDISEIIGKCRHDLTLEASFSPGGTR